MRNIFMKNHAENISQKLVPVLFLILLTKSSHCLQEILKKRLSKSLKKVILLSNPVPLMGKIVKNKKSLELETCRSSGYKTSAEKFLY